MGLWYTNGSPNHGQKTRPYNNQQKKRICKIVVSAVLADHRIKRQHCWGWPEYWDESWRLEETCCHSNSSEKPLTNSDVKNSRGIIIIIIIISKRN